MGNSPLIATMGQSLVEHTPDLTSDRAVILCLIACGYDARDIQNDMDGAIAFARRIYDARGALQFDRALRTIAAVMRDDHAA